MKRSLPNLRHLRAFREVAECRNISQASFRVHLSQPAVSQAIAKLEACLGLPLFHRRSNGVYTSDAGALFLNRVNRALAFLERGARQATRSPRGRGSRTASSFDKMITMPQLRALVAVSNADNFSLAARLIGISQPSLHRAARDLERLSGVALFEKVSQGIALTDAGERLVLQTKLAFAELEQGFVEIAESQGMDTARIMVGSLPLARTYVLPRAINKLHAARPDVQVSVIDGPYSDMLRGLRHGEIDVMIGALRHPSPIDDVKQVPLFSAPLAVVARSGHPLAGKRRLGIGDLAAYPWVVPRENTPTRAHFEALFTHDGPRPFNVIESSSLILVRGLLAASDRLTLISAHQIMIEREQGMLVPLDYDLPDTEREIGLTLRRDWQPTSSQKAFLDMLRSAAMALPAQKTKTSSLSGSIGSS